MDIQFENKKYYNIYPYNETSFFVNNKRNPVWYISLGEYKELSIYIARKLNNIHNMCNLCSYYQCCSLYLHVYW